MVPLGRWILEETCRQAKQWFDEGIAPPTIAVNVSAAQLKTVVDFEAAIDAALEHTGLPARYLELELTETTLMETSLEHNDVLQRIHDRGIRLAIDDFGTGYSSPEYLRRFPVDRIKIAQTFVAHITSDAGDVAIVKATIGLASELKINVIAEGVETAAQLDLLTRWGCREVQGFYVSEPLSSIRNQSRASHPADRPGRRVDVRRRIISASSRRWVHCNTLFCVVLPFNVQPERIINARRYNHSLYRQNHPDLDRNLI